MLLQVVDGSRYSWERLGFSDVFDAAYPAYESFHAYPSACGGLQFSLFCEFQHQRVVVFVNVVAFNFRKDFFVFPFSFCARKHFAVLGQEQVVVVPLACFGVF
jgi:hypothetical protein